jgi:hypothetical protein
MEMKGFEMKYLHYDVPKENQSLISVEDNVKEAFIYTNSVLKDFDFSQYDKIVFLSKSLGTVVASLLKKEHKLNNVYQIMITPLEATLPYIEEQDIVITSDSDHFLPDASKKLEFHPQTYIISDLPHSLESKDDVHFSIQVADRITSMVEEYLGKIL